MVANRYQHTTLTAIWLCVQCGDFMYLSPHQEIPQTQTGLFHMKATLIRPGKQGCKVLTDFTILIFYCLSLGGWSSIPAHGFCF
jgi:hypothetical protein